MPPGADLGFIKGGLTQGTNLLGIYRDVRSTLPSMLRMLELGQGRIQTIKKGGSIFGIATSA